MNASSRSPTLSVWRCEPKHEREIKHDLTAALPYRDNSIAKIQAQDVLEHLPFDKVALSWTRFIAC